MIYHGKDHVSSNARSIIRSDLSDLGRSVQEATDTLQPHISEFDSIAVTGVSGILVGAPVALALGKPIVIVRKPYDDHHNSESVVNQHRAGKRYLFLDDFIGLGRTRERVIEALHDKSKYAGSYLYASDELLLDGGSAK
jgi:adenine/guanine phosphoribosyltransferase-like PRPP-binding protein